MLVGSVLKKLLWVFRYPSFPSELVGPYKVGAIQTRIPGSTACQIHYPADGSSSPSKNFHSYFRPKAVEGLADYSRTNPGLLGFLSNRNHPCVIGADPPRGESFPIVIFSHGLGGCMEMYTQLCQQIASHGFWVMALEHEDGSGAFAETEVGERIPYKRPDDSPYSRHKVLNFRRPFLRQRIQETTSALEYILASPSKDGMDPHVQKVLQAADRSQDVALLGHSFGGASMIMAARDYLSKDSTSSLIRPASLSVLDPWAFSLEDQILQEGVYSIPTLSILSESWLTNPETTQVKELLVNSEKVTSLYAPKSVHASFADSVSWLPGFFLRKLNMRGKKERRHETVRSVANACVRHIRNTMINNVSDSYDADHYCPLQPFSVSQKDQAKPTTLS